MLGRIGAMRNATNPRAGNYNPALQGQIDFMKDNPFGTGTAYGNDWDQSGLNKITGGRLAGKNLNIDTVVLRYQNVYGPGQSLSNPYTGILSIFSTRILNGNDIDIYEDGLESRDFIYIDDVVESFIRCLKYEDSYNEVINIGTGIKTSVRDLISSLLIISNKKVSVKYSGNTLGDVHGVTADNDKCKSLLRLNKLTSINEGLTKMWLWANNLN
jgi:dTDP-L-rhamnose 4-epimerase